MIHCQTMGVDVEALEAGFAVEDLAEDVEEIVCNATIVSDLVIQDSYAAEENEAGCEEDEKLFMMCAGDVQKHGEIWFIGSGCSNHMTGQRHAFCVLDETKKMTVQLGDGKVLHGEGKGTVKIQMANGKVRFLEEVDYIPDLGYGLLSVGQMVEPDTQFSLRMQSVLLAKHNKQ